jgi:hypothetical protein
VTSLRKYPRTPHLAGSQLQPGDDDIEIVPFEELAGRHCVVEEKVDGANAGISFDGDATLRLQSRGHFLRGGARERQFHLFHAWASTYQQQLHECLGSRYVLYGEWLYAKHTIYYDALPHYFLSFDVLDTHDGSFSSASRCRELLDGLPLVSVPVLFEGQLGSPQELLALLGPSRLKTPRWRTHLCGQSVAQGLDPTRVLAETDDSDFMEGLYIKVEDSDRVIARYKYVRPTFRTTVVESAGHWLQRPIIANRLMVDVNLFEP